MNNQECKINPQIININTDNLFFYPYSTQVNKCSGICNNINSKDAKLYVSGVVQDINLKLFNIVSRTNETRHIKWHENVNADQMQEFVVINNVETKINVDVSVNNQFTKEDVMKDLFGVLVNLINHVMLENI